MVFILLLISRETRVPGLAKKLCPKRGEKGEEMAEFVTKFECKACGALRPSREEIMSHIREAHPGRSVTIITRAFLPDGSPYIPPEEPPFRLKRKRPFEGF